ncbi:MAG: hypothetical protein NT094_03305 [Candidatus Staskawiczbacteria bacterium]|nr:hypothetical protein [Candidatus Staskawiczbacteria bacterium]
MINEQVKSSLVETFSGVRGIYGQDINEELAYKYALAYCLLFKNKGSVLIIGGDTRASTKAIKKVMIRAFCDFGVKKIIDIGIVPIQVCEYAIFKFKASGGVYITASHNEPEYNGWKFLEENGAILYKERSEKLINKAHNNKEKISINKKSSIKITNENKKAINGYIELVLKTIGKEDLNKIKKSNLKILADPNGGSSIIILDKLFKKIGVKAKIINNEIGKFVRLIEPNVKSLAYLSEQIDSENFEFGCGFDCDSDRVEFILPSRSNFAKEMGQMVSGQYVLALACDIFLKNTKNQIVATTDCTSYLVRDIIKKYRAKIKETEVGETNVVREIEKQKSIIGGEGNSSGVIIPPVKCRDGIMATVLILKIIVDREKSLSDILESYPKYYSDRIKKECLPSDYLKIKKDLENYFKNKGYKIKKTGGAKGSLKIFFTENSYLWFRESKTEPGSFRIIADGDNKEKVKNMLEKGAEIFDKFNN